MKNLGGLTFAVTFIGLLLFSGCSNGAATPAQTSAPTSEPVSAPSVQPTPVPDLSPTPSRLPTSTVQPPPGDGSSVAGFRANPQRTGFFETAGVREFSGLKWKFEVAGAYQPPNVRKYSTYAVAAVQSSPAVLDGVVYVGSNDLHLYAVDIETGQQVWRFLARPVEYQNAGPVMSSPVIAAGSIFFGTIANHLFALHIDNGKEIWKFKTGSAVLSSPAIADGIVFFGS